MLDQERLREAIEQSTKEVFLTMLGIEVETLDQQAMADGGVMSLVGITGNWSGTGTVCCTPAVAANMAAKMLLLEDREETSIDEEVLDATAELTNMIVGNTKNFLAPDLGELAISVPTVIYGRNFRFRSFAGMVQEQLGFQWEGNQITVQICLAPTAEQSAPARQRLACPAFCAE